MLESAATTFASIVVLGVGFAAGGYLYHRFYKYLVVAKIENAFKPGDPALEIAAVSTVFSLIMLIPASRPL